MFVPFIVFSFSTAILQPQTVIPQGVPNQTYIAAFPITVTLDGDFGEWSGLPYAEVTEGPQPSPNPQEDGALQFAAAADVDHLYFSIQVIDANIIAGQHGDDYWNEDSVEIYINATGNLDLITYQPGVMQITVPAANMGIPSSEATLSGLHGAESGATASVVETPDGYAIEMAVPLVNDVWNIVPQTGGIIGFQIQLNGATENDRDIKLSWSVLNQMEDQTYHNPSVFGQLIFMDISQPANFTVLGSTIYTPEGTPFVAKGVNVSGANWVWYRPIVPDADLIIECWGFNLVRVNSFLFTGEVAYEQSDINNDLDAFVRTFTQRNIVVIFEAHDRIGGYYEGEALTTLVAWYTDLATRYRDNPYVWFDVMNEPGGAGVDAENWLGMHQAVINAIRNGAGANNIIMVEGVHGGQDASDRTSEPVAEADSAILSLADEILSFDGQRYNNIVFSIHTYDQWNFDESKMADYFDRVLARNLALIVGEYGVFTTLDTTVALRALFNTAVPRSIGRIAWQWDGGDSNDLTVETTYGSGWEIDDCAYPTNLSEYGLIVWNDNHATSSDDET